MSKKVISGTKEWAKHNVNCCTGCQHNCRYCYARYDAVDRFHRIEKGKWTEEVIRVDAVNKKYPKKDGTIMFPTQHDITPGNFAACLTVLTKMLASGNNVLVVSKPHLSCIKPLCEACKPYKDQLLFRFTIGAHDDLILNYWEPGAPGFKERYDCLQHAFNMGFRTSISMEPLLQHERVVGLYFAFEPFVTDSIWIGMMNKIRSRVKIETAQDEQMVAAVEVGQTPEKVREIYEALKAEPKVRWKESYKTVLGLPTAEQEGLDV